jgi:4-alpha-glucanotransferase
MEGNRRELRLMMEFAGLKNGEPPRDFTGQVHEAFTRTVMQSPSWLAVFQITDVFGMTARFNTPGSVAATNWSYRIPHTVKELDEDPVLLELTRMFSRLAQESGRVV